MNQIIIEDGDGDPHSSSHQLANVESTEGSSSGYESLTTESAHISKINKQPNSTKQVKMEMNKAAMVEPASVADYLSQPFASSPEKGTHEVEDLEFKTPLTVDPVKPVDQSLVEVASQLNNDTKLQEKDDLEHAVINETDSRNNELLKENEVQKVNSESDKGDMLQDSINGKCQYCGRGSEPKIPECSERQTLLASASRPSEKASWKNCCGIFELFSGSTRSFVMKPMNFSKVVGSGMSSGSDDVTLFSSSLPVLPHEKLILNDSEDSENGYHQYVETNDLLEDTEDHAIGSLLPDEDDLLAGVMDGFDLNLMPNHVDESEDFDLFGSGGGMEMESDMIDNMNFGMSKVSLGDGGIANGGALYSIPSNGVGTVAGQHPYGEHPSRTLFVRNINSNVEDSELRSLFEQYGDIRTLYTACKHRGFVMISYYDIRAARTAMRALQNKPLRRRKLDIHYSIPKDNPSDKDINQGTLVVFNLDPSVSCEDLFQIFGAYGEVKEIRETPYKRHHKFIEYYDVRAAEAALRSLNRSDIAGKRIKLEPSRPGGARRNLMLQLSHEFDQDDARSFRLQVGPSTANSSPGVWAQFGSPIEHSPLQSLTKSPVFTSMSPKSLPELVSILHPQPARIAPIGKDHARASYLDQTFYGNAMQDRKLSSSSGSMSTFGASGSTTSEIETLSGPQFLWGSPNRRSDGFPTTGQCQSPGMVSWFISTTPPFWVGSIWGPV
ncbi:hypothetical protein SSX86_027920 [Deinandra increscens subsp. villosa]|uniref:RRM domain-containing protein n=1 Tax=Deinandra increscens subsp. villosa TaxID=3103831 RepID=A0AAP0CD79_9ASTR